MIHLRPDVRAILGDRKTVSDFLRLECDVKRRFKNRHTGRFEVAGRGFYIKAYDRAGWWAIIDELLHLRRPQIGAADEKHAIETVQRLGVATMNIAAFGEEGRAGPRQRSFIVTDEIAPTISLETLCAGWSTQPPDPDFKRRLIRAVATIARKLHQGGVNHRDFYICHFLLDTSNGLAAAQRGEPKLHLIDLHRAQVRRTTPRRWLIKDLAGVYFSAMDAGLSRRDVLRFVKTYTGGPLHRTLDGDRHFWIKVQARATALYRDHWHKPPPIQL